ncbi:MAG: hypothetical protein V4538_13200 [Bacteroidota bacterium]
MKQFILITFYIFTSLGIQAKNKLVIVVNPKTCRYCLHTIKGTNIIDSVIAKTLYFRTDINEEQIAYFIKSNFPKTFTNYRIIQNDSLVDFYNAFDSNYIVKGMGAIVSDSNKILSHFNLDYINNYVPQINWFCKDRRVNVSIKEVPQIRPLIDFFTISKSEKNLIIAGYGEALFVFDNNLKLVKEINFNNDSICTWFYRKLHKTDIWLEYFLRTSRDSKTYDFLSNTVYKNKVVFPFAFDSVYVQYDTGYLPPSYFIGTYHIDKDSLVVERIHQPSDSNCYISPEYVHLLSDDIYRFKLKTVNRTENDPAFAIYKKVKGKYVYQGLEKPRINNVNPRISIGYPENIFINDECIVQYKSMTFESLKDNIKIALKCTDFADGKKRHSSVFDCRYNNNIIKLTAINENQLIEYFFNLKGDIIHKNYYALGEGMFKISSNTAALPNDYSFINKLNQLVTITLSEY